jgi:hypothetical protein
MSGAGPSLRARNYWRKREAQFLAVLKRALVLLRMENFIPEAECDLNRRLYFCLLEATRELCPKDGIAPTWECNNQPDPDDEARARREQKRPDFQWIYLDQYEPDPRRSSKQFVVECKRLGMASRADWVLNLNYVEHGICRFRDSQWAYARRFVSGAMVGYWQAMEAEQVLREVNAVARKNALTELALEGTWNYAGVSTLGHTFERSFEVSPFHLHHLWVDLRSLSQQGAGRGRRAARMPKTAKIQTILYDVAEQLCTPEEMAAYMDAWLAEAPDDAAGIARALGDIARAQQAGRA